VIHRGHGACRQGGGFAGGGKMSPCQLTQVAVKDAHGAITIHVRQRFKICMLASNFQHCAGMVTEPCLYHRVGCDQTLMAPVPAQA